MLHSISQKPYIVWLSFMVQMCKMIISLGFFSIWNFDFLICRSWKGKKWPKMTNISVYHTLYFRNHISYDLHLWYTCIYKRIISPAIFFIFFKILIFGIIEVNGQKMAQNDKNFLSLSQELYIIWLWFLVHMCKMMISPANFFIFQNFDFWGF